MCEGWCLHEVGRAREGSGVCEGEQGACQARGGRGQGGERGLAGGAGV